MSTTYTDHENFTSDKRCITCSNKNEGKGPANSTYCEGFKEYYRDKGRFHDYNNQNINNCPHFYPNYSTLDAYDEIPSSSVEKSKSGGNWFIWAVAIVGILYFLGK